MPPHSKKTVRAVVDTAIVFTPDMARLSEFYRQGFGLGEPSQSPGHIGFELPGLYLGFDQVEAGAHSWPGAVTLWFRVREVDSVYEHLLELGAESVYAPSLKPWGDYIAAVSDPDGNVVGLSQHKE